MQHPIRNIALIAAFASIIAKMLYFIFLAPDKAFDMYVRFFYLLCFLAGLFFGVRSWKIQRGASAFTDDIKSGMKVASIYALVVSGFTWLYYAKINPGYFAQRIEERVHAAEQAIAAGAENADQIDLAQVEQTVGFIFNAFTHASLTLFGLMALGFFYTIIIVMLFRWKPRPFGITG